jgi:hypothetical protein
VPQNWWNANAVSANITGPVSSYFGQNLQERNSERCWGVVADCSPPDAVLIVLDLGDGTCAVLTGVNGDVVGDCTSNIFGGTQCTVLEADLFIIPANLNSLGPSQYVIPDFQPYFDAIGIGSIIALSAPPSFALPRIVACSVG